MSDHAAPELSPEELAQLTPAEHVEQPPAAGWAGADLHESELVDDEFIGNDPTSRSILPYGGLIRGT